MSQFATRELLLAPRPIPHEDVNIPELGVTVRVRGMSVSQRSRFEASYESSGKTPQERIQTFRERLLAACCVGEDGKPLFEPGDVKAIGELDCSIVEPLVDAASRLCGFTSKDVASLVKNSEGTTDAEQP